MDKDRTVVIFGAGPDVAGRCWLSHCPMGAYGPYTQDEAERFAESLPAWMQPHILRLDQGPSSE